MIDPNNITKYDRSDRELLEFWLFCILVAGKKSSLVSRKVEEIDKVFNLEVVFSCEFHLVDAMLRACKVGQYNRISHAIYETRKVNLRTASFVELMQIKGIGRKSASFFLLHSREGWEGVVLDTHLLAFLRDNGVSAPMSTPQEADLTVWKAYSGKNKLALEQNAELI
jgi:thermostable 8-oxoguanine DNA glycosylase